MRQLISAGVLLAASIAVACGGSGSTPVATTLPDGGTTLPDGGGSPDASTPPTNPDGGAPKADAGVPDAGDGGAPDAGFADCEDVVPAQLGPSVNADASLGPGRFCRGATSDQAGVVAANEGPATSGDVPIEQWDTFSPDGGRLGGFEVRQFPEVIPQANGFIGSGGDAIFLFQENGTLAKAIPAENQFILQQPFPASTGGTVAIAFSCSQPPGSFTVTLYDASLGRIGGTDLPMGGCENSAAGGDELGNALVAFWQGQEQIPGFGGHELVGRWFNSTGKPMGDFFSISHEAIAGSEVLIRSLIGGGVAVRLDGHWVATIASGQASVAQPPAWLASKPNHDLAIIRQRSAYALIPNSGQNDRGTLQLVSSAGNSCGTLAFPGADTLHVGADGTVIGKAAEGACKITWWPHLLH
jgi:hypothetical protein